MALCLFTWRLTTSLNYLKTQKYSIISLKNGGFKLQKFSSFSTISKSFEESSTESDSDSDGEVPKNEADLKMQILKAGLNFVPEHGWSKKSIALGAQSLGISTASHGLIQDGGCDLVHYFNFLCNERLEKQLKEKCTEKLDFQNFIEYALENRLRLVIPYVSRWSEALALMVSPAQFPSDTKHLIDLVDIIWHYAGDKSVNILWYSKRASLALTYRMCELSLVQDRSPDYSDTFAFLQRHVEKVLHSDQFLHGVSDNCKHLPHFAAGTFTTIQNILGINRTFR